MKNKLKVVLYLLLLILIAYITAWFNVYNQSKQYFEYAEEQYKNKNYILALKGMNKIELYPEDHYDGGYQQVVNAWANGLLVYKPNFYYDSVDKSKLILQKATNKELNDFIDTYTEIDTTYIPEAAVCLLSRYEKENNQTGQIEMKTFLGEAFPSYKWNNSDYYKKGCHRIH